MKLGIIGCSEIAYRRFMPAIQGVDEFEVVAVAEEYAPEKLNEFCDTYKLEPMKSFEQLICREDIEAVYIPQPPALHYKWAKFALEHGKHVLIEKPSTTSYKQTCELVETAKKNNLALHENYMFQYHSQIGEIKKIIESGKIGETRLFKANFTFPMRQANDFRYVKALGGGALLDAGGYTLKLATILLGDTIKLDTCTLNGKDGYEVDMYGSATLSNDAGSVCQVSFGMDCAYQCNLEVIGSKGKLTTDRVFTAPPEHVVKIFVDQNGSTECIELEPDSHFRHSIEEFGKEIISNEKRLEMYNSILLQAELVEKAMTFK